MNEIEKAKEWMDYMIGQGKKTINNKEIDTTTMAHTMQVLGLPQKKIREVMWNEIVQYLKTHDKVQFPEYVDPALYDEILGYRCAVKATYKGGIKTNEQDVLEKIAKKTGAKNSLNFKKELCVAVKELNAMEKMQVNKSIEKCQNKLDEFSKLGIQYVSEVDKRDLEERLKKVRYYLDRWNEYETYTDENKLICEQGGCTNQLNTMHKLYSVLVKETDDCSSKINTMITEAKKLNIVRREAQGEEVGWFEKAKVNLGF